MSRLLVLIALLSAALPASATGGIEAVGVLPPRVEIVEVDARGAVRRVTALEGSTARKLVAHLADALAQRRFEPRIAESKQIDGAGREIEVLHAAVTASLNGGPRQDISAEAESLALRTGVEALLIANYYQEQERRRGRLGFNPFSGIGNISFPSSSGRDAVLVIVVIVVVVAVVAAISQFDLPARPTYESLEVGLIDGRSGEILWAKRTTGSRPALIRTIATTLRSLPWKRFDHATSPVDL